MLTPYHDHGGGLAGLDHIYIYIHIYIFTLYTSHSTLYTPHFTLYTPKPIHSTRSASLSVVRESFATASVSALMACSLMQVAAQSASPESGLGR